MNLGLRLPSRDTLLGRALRGILASRKATIARPSSASCCSSRRSIGPLLAPQNPYDLLQINIFDAKLPPGSASMHGGIYWLGTDGQGRDMLSAMIYGLRTSLAVGLSSGIFALVVGTALGLSGGLFRRAGRMH